MADISGARIGGRLEDMDLIQADLDATGARAGDHAGATAARVERLQREVADVSAQLKVDFVDMAAQLAQAVARSTASMESADWDGRSRGAANAANAAFAVDIDRVLAGAQEGVDRLHAALSSQVMAFFDEVNGSFASIMASVQDNYSNLALGTRQYAAKLAEDDAVAIRFG